MARKSSDRLRTLLKLAAMREDAAAQRLARSNEQLLNARQQSQQLEQYEHDYQQRYVDGGTAPVGKNFLLNYQGFFRQLERAQLQQHRQVELRSSDREQARLGWLEQHMKRKVLTRLRDQRLASEALVLEKKLQRDLDDRSARRYFDDAD
ncbi:MAG: flagellar export protein FliJ [Spongiibacteraceae bacterium]